VKKLEDAVPTCARRSARLALGKVVTKADRCPLCGGYHVVALDWEVVESGDDDRPVRAEGE
jgi:hypothetical protein